MENFSQPSLPPHRRTGGHLVFYRLGLLAIFLFSLGLRLWSLDRFNQLAFDEIYYVKYGLNYLRQQPIFDAHPPLGKYLIALGIWLGDRLLFPGLTASSDLTHDLAGKLLSPYSYRWLNAVVGSTIPLLIAGVARQLKNSPSLGLLAGGLAALDGFFLVESRFALLHVYLVAFGLLGHWCGLRALRLMPKQRWPWLLAAGLSFGACVSVKWNGLGYWIGAVGLWFLHWAWYWSRSWGQSWSKSWSKSWRWRSQPPELQAEPSRSPRPFSLPQVLLFFILIPIAFYALQWLPHLRFNSDSSLLELHRQILSFHRGSSVTGSDIHAYCSPWWSWPLLIRPIAYALSTGGDPPVYFAVYALGNPLLWWFSTAAIAFVLGKILQITLRSLRTATLPAQNLAVALYLLVNYLANWLPWAAVTRCTFIYHYLGSLSFSIIALACWLHSALQLGLHRQGDLQSLEPPRHVPEWRWGAIALGLLIAIAFGVWLPLWLGLPLSQAGFYRRLLLPSWP